MGLVLGRLGAWLGRYLSQPIEREVVTPPTPRDLLLAALRPGDVLLVEGSSRVSTAIKYLTQSTWSHAAIYVGSALAGPDGRPEHRFVEADIVEGVRAVGIEEFEQLPTRICRPAGISPDDRARVVEFVLRRLGHHYDLRNVFDLLRYLLPTPPVPERFRRRMLALGSGDPTRAICSTLIAQAFQSVHYPILPRVQIVTANDPDCPDRNREVMHLRHYSLFAPRDFDVSPYFEIVKPSLARAAAYHELHWADLGGRRRPRPRAEDPD